MLHLTSNKHACKVKLYYLNWSILSEKTNDLKLGDANHVHQMAQSGVGLWISLRNSATICLYHTETFRHLQDINIASKSYSFSK